jgi:WD40 repeat protein/tRNA A-37 threonylcarbamoyl transferase component Bud32
VEPCPTPDVLAALLDDGAAGPSDRGALERHVEHCCHCQALLERLTGDSLLDDAGGWHGTGVPPPGGLLGLWSRAAGPGPPDSADPRPARRAGPAPAGPPGYVLLEEVGRGGMGVVYRARQELLGRVVALKTIRGDELDSAARRVRFRTEAEVIAAIEHPNIIRVHEIIETDETLWLSLEFCSGGSLATGLAAGPLPARAAAALIESLARAVAAAHASGVIHRDLKPANVLYTATGVPKITDFGLARRLEWSNLTVDGAVMGTPSYMAPEQARGSAADLGPRTDVYALGAILYECLTGRPPFRAATAAETVREVLDVDPLPPRRLQPQTPRDLDTICLECLEKQPARRYETAAALADDLRRWLDGLPIRARPIGPAARAGRFAARNPVVAALVAAVAVSVVVGMGLVGWQWRRAEGARSQAEERQALLALTRGTTLCEAGEIDQGTLWFARAAELIERSRLEPLDRAWRVNLADWCRRLPRVRWAATHPVACNQVAFHPDGSLVASAGNDCQVRFWDAATGAAAGSPLWVYLPPLHTRVWDVAFSPDGRRLLSGGADGRGVLWDVATRRRLHALEHAPDSGHVNVWTVAFSPDGTLAATCGPGTAVRIWRTDTGVPDGPPIEHGAALRTVAFSPDGRTLWAAGFDANEVRRYDVATREPVLPSLQQTDLVQSIRFSPDGRWLVTGSYEGHLSLWDLATFRSHRLPFQSGQVSAVAFSPDGGVFATAAGGLVRLWDPWHRQPVGPILRHDGDVSSLAFGPDSRTLAVAERSGPVRLWELPAPGSRPPVSSGGPVLGLSFDRSGRRLLVARQWHWALHDTSGDDWPETRRQEEADGRLDGAVLSPDGRTVATGGRDSSVVLWDAETATATATLERHAGPVRLVAFDPTGRRLVAAANSDHSLTLLPRDRARLWDVGAARPIRSLLGGLTADVSGVAWHPDGGVVLVGCGDRTARLVDAETGAAVGEPLPHPSTVTAVAFTPDGTRFVTGCRDGTLRTWDFATRAPLGRPLRLAREVTAVAFDAGGGTVLAGDLGGTARFWDPVSGEPLGVPLHHAGAIRFAAFHPGGRAVVTAGDDGHVRRWDVPPPPVPGSAAEMRARVEEATGLALDADGTIDTPAAR